MVGEMNVEDLASKAILAPSKGERVGFLGRIESAWWDQLGSTHSKTADIYCARPPQSQPATCQPTLYAPHKTETLSVRYIKEGRKTKIVAVAQKPTRAARARI